MNTCRTMLMRLCLPASLMMLLVLSGCIWTDASERALTNEKKALPYFNEASFTPHWYASRSSVPEDFHQIPEFTLVDQTGQLISEETFENKFYIANFFFTACPGICPMTMNNMARLQQAFEEDSDVMLLSHSVTPEKDSVAALKAFAEKTRALSSKWYLATGDRDLIYRLGKEFYFAEEDLGETRPVGEREEAFLHTESFLLIDKDRRIRGVYNGMNTASVNQLIDDVRTLQSEG